MGSFQSDELLRTENLILMHDVIKYQVSVEEYFHNLLAVVNLGYFITSRFTSSFLCPQHQSHPVVNRTSKFSANFHIILLLVLPVIFSIFSSIVSFFVYFNACAILFRVLYRTFAFVIVGRAGSLRFTASSVANQLPVAARTARHLVETAGI